MGKLEKEIKILNVNKKEIEIILQKLGARKIDYCRDFNFFLFAFNGNVSVFCIIEQVEVKGQAVITISHIRQLLSKFNVILI